MFNKEKFTHRNTYQDEGYADKRSPAEKKRDYLNKLRKIRSKLTGEVFETKGGSCYLVLPEDHEAPEGRLPAIPLGDYTNIRPEIVFIPYIEDYLVTEQNMGSVIAKHGIEISEIRKEIQKNKQETILPLTDREKFDF
jgi:hypothetical protein